VLTDQAFYLISPNKIHSKMKIGHLTYIIKGQDDTQQVILCFKNDSKHDGGLIDVHVSTMQRDSLLETIKS